MRIIEIPLSRKKLMLGIIGSILFVISGVWLFTHSSDFQNIPFRLFRNPTVIKSVGIAGIIFFGSTGIYGIKKMFDKAIGLTIDENGITDNSNASSVGLVEWNDITEIRTEQVMSTKFLLIFIANPDFYIDKVKGFKKKLLQGNNKMYGTPISITSNTLKFSFDDLEKLIIDGLKEYKEKMPNR